MFLVLVPVVDPINARAYQLSGPFKLAIIYRGRDEIPVVVIPKSIALFTWFSQQRLQLLVSSGHTESISQPAPSFVTTHVFPLPPAGLSNHVLRVMRFIHAVGRPPLPPAGINQWRAELTSGLGVGNPPARPRWYLSHEVPADTLAMDMAWQSWQ